MIPTALECVMYEYSPTEDQEHPSWDSAAGAARARLDSHMPVATSHANSSASLQVIADAVARWLIRDIAHTGVRDLPDLGASFGTSRGRTRSENQDQVALAIYDSTVPDEGFQLLAVADGLGGMQYGRECSSLAVAHVVEHLIATRRVRNRATRLRAAVSHASKKISQRFRERGGTTFAGILLSRAGATGIAVGDTRIHQLSTKGDLVQLSVDDTVAGRLAELHQPVTAGGRFANQLAQFVGQDAELTSQLFELSAVLFKRGRKDAGGRSAVLVTTDGAHALPKSVFDGIARAAASPRELVSRLLEISDWLGGHDNASALYIGESDYPARRDLGHGMQLVRIVDSFGELEIPIMDAHLQEIALSEGPAIQQPSRAASDFRGTRDKPRSKGRRKSAGKKKRGDKVVADDSDEQPQLDIEVIQHHE